MIWIGSSSTMLSAEDNRRERRKEERIDDVCDFGQGFKLRTFPFLSTARLRYPLMLFSTSDSFDSSFWGDYQLSFARKSHCVNLPWYSFAADLAKDTGSYVNKRVFD
jgi:hypothetical protein